MVHSMGEIDWDKNTLITLEGKAFRINPFDMSVLAGWTPTTPIREVTIDGIKYIECYGERVRLR